MGESGPPSLPVPTEGTSASIREDNQGEDSDLLSLRGRKRTASEDPETETSKREKKSPIEGPASRGALAAQSPRGDQPSNELSDLSPSQLSSSSVDLLPEMMESKRPPPDSPAQEAGDIEVSSRRASPDPVRPEDNPIVT